METEPLEQPRPAAPKQGPPTTPLPGAPPAAPSAPLGVEPPVQPGPHRKLRIPIPPNARTFLIVCVAVVVIIALAVWRHAAHAPAGSADPAVVAVAKVVRKDMFNDVRIPAEFRPYVEVELHAKVSGYVDHMNVDFGDKVKAGQLLATLEVPELQDQLRNAIANQEKAEADYTNAHLIYTRLQAVNQQNPNLVAEQDLDTARARDGSAVAAIAAAKADVERYQTLVNYTQITAPFDGVVTGRFADPGALIQAGTTADAQPQAGASSDNQSKALLRVSDNYHLRLDFPVSVAYVHDIHVGDTAEVSVDSLGGKKFTGTITRFTDKVAEDTRTMIFELEIPNPNLEIAPGMYASVDLKVQRHPQTLAIPIQAVGDADHPDVYVVNADSEIESHQITLGLETPNDYEVTSGLQEGDLVVVGNRAFVHPGQKVETKIVSQYAGP